MKEKIEYYPNGRIKHIIVYYDNGSSKHYEFFYNKKRIFNCKPIYGDDHNSNYPGSIYFHPNGKISRKYYFLFDSWSLTKLKWQNLIKNI